MNKFISFFYVCICFSLVSMSLPTFSAPVCQTYHFNRAHTATLTLGGGYYFFAPKRNIENTGTALLMAGYNFTNQWGIEGLIGVLNTEFRNQTEDDHHINGTLFAVDGLYHFTPFHNMQPYLMAGVGVLGLDHNETDANNEANINAGVGVQLYFNPIVALRADARDFYTINGGKNDFMIDLGVTFLFDCLC